MARERDRAPQIRTTVNGEQVSKNLKIYSIPARGNRVHSTFNTSISKAGTSVSLFPATSKRLCGG